MKKSMTVLLTLMLGVACGDENSSSTAEAVVEAAAAERNALSAFCQCAAKADGPICTDSKPRYTCYQSMAECLEVSDAVPASWQPDACLVEAYALDNAGVVAWAECATKEFSALEACLKTVQSCNLGAIEACLARPALETTCGGVSPEVGAALEACY